MKKSNFPEKQNARRMRVIVRLEEQLKEGTKREKNTNRLVPLEKTDKERIKRELVSLNAHYIPDARSKRTKKNRSGVARISKR